MIGRTKIREKKKESDKKPKRGLLSRFMREDLGPGKAVLKPRKDQPKSKAPKEKDAEAPFALEEDNAFDPYNTTTFDRGAIWRDPK